MIYAEAWKTISGEMDDRAGISSLVSEMHFFDARAVQDVIDLMAGEMWRKRAASVDLARMAAPMMWFEFPGGALVLLRVTMPDGSERANIVSVYGTRSDHVGAIALGDRVLDDLNSIVSKSGAVDLQQVDTEFRLHALALLSLVNDRTIADTSARQPARQQRRALARAGKSAPLEAWTEITLKHRRPIRSSHGAGGLTGVMPLHFVLGHRRRVFGVPMWIDGYWRGDEDNGVKRTRYKLAA